MALRIADRVKETWTGTGTGTLTLGGAVTGFNTFASAFADGVTCYYVIEHASLGAWEIGEGTMGGTGTTLARTSVIASSNANALVSFATGTKMVFCTAPATYLVTASGTLTTGSVPFFDSRGRLIEDNANLSFNDTTNVLSAANVTVATNLTVSTMTAASVLFAGTAGLVSQDNANLSYNDATNTLSVANATVATNLTLSTMTAGSVLFAGTSGLVSQDNANLFYEDANNVLLLGATASDATIDAGTTRPIFQIHAITNGAAFGSMYRWQAAAGSARWVMAKSRGAAVGTRGVVSSGDNIGVLLFEGDDGTNFQPAGNITVQVDATPGANDMPGRMVFSTTPDGTAASSEAMRIDNAQNLLIGTSTAVSGSKVVIAGVLTTMSTTATAAGANTQAFIKASTTANLGLYYGTGAPTFSAGKGSLYTRTDATTTTTRLYVNTDGATTWATYTASA